MYTTQSLAIGRPTDQIAQKPSQSPSEDVPTAMSQLGQSIEVLEQTISELLTRLERGGVLASIPNSSEGVKVRRTMMTPLGCTIDTHACSIQEAIGRIRTLMDSLGI